MSPAPARTNPFPGLRPFTQEEDYLFFGREEQTLELLQRLGSHRFVAVVGTSGSGKSSLVRCGLLSELLGGRMLEAGAAWEIAVTHPGGNPLALLTDALLEADLYDREAEHARENLLATLSRSHFGLVEAVKQADLGEGTNFLLVVDQFEEIFRFQDAGQRQQEVANEFVSLLLEAVAQKETPIYVVLTMRSDFIGECGQFEGLAEMVNRGEFLIPRLTREQYKRVIEGPIKVAGGQIAPRLLQRLLNDLGQQADQLPCLQHALMRTWNLWAEKGETNALDLDDYQRVGRMSQALSLHADEIYESLASDRQRALCQGIFQALTVEESNNRGIRRPQRLGRLCQILDVSAGELLPIIDAYRQSGVTFLMPAPDVELADQTIIDISHESLMRVWTRLRQWVEEETQAAGIYHRLSESAALHAQGKAGLYRDPELGIALAWREAKCPNAAWAERYRPGFDTAIGFLEASQRASVAEEQAREAARQRELQQAQQLAEVQQLRLEQQQRAARKLRKLIAGVAVVAVIAVLACVAALVARNEAGKLAQIAAQEAENARNNAQRAEQSQQETAQALTLVESQKAKVESSLTKAEKAERLAREAEQKSRNLVYATDMELAAKLWSDDQTTADQFSSRLTAHVPGQRDGQSDAADDLRGYEWHYYQHLLEHGAAVISGLEQPVVDIALTADGRLLSLDDQALLSRWNTETCRRIGDPADLKQGHRNVGDKGLSPDGRLAAMVVGRKTVHIVNTTTGETTTQVDVPDLANRSYGIVLSADGQALVIVDSQKVQWRETAAGKIIAALDYNLGNRLDRVVLSSDGQTLAVVHGNLGNELSIFRLDAKEKKLAHLRKYDSPGTLGPMAFSPDGELLVFSHYFGGNLNVLPAGSGDPSQVKQSAHAAALSAMAFSREGILATASSDGTIKTWTNPRQPALKATLRGHRDRVVNLLFSSDGRQLASAGADKTLRIWNEAEPDVGARPLAGAGITLRSQFSPDGLLIAAANISPASSGDVRLWDAATGQLVRAFSSDDKGVPFSVAFSPDGRTLAAGYGGEPGVSHVLLWDVDSGRRLAQLPGLTDVPGITTDANTGWVSALAFSPDGKHLVAGFGSKFFYNRALLPTPLKVWDVATRQPIRRLEGHTNFCVSASFSRDGAWLASACYDGTVRIWNTTTWKTEQTLQNPDPTTNTGGGRAADAVFSPDGRYLAMASHEGNVIVWDVKTWKPKEVLKGHSSAVNALAFSPNGRTLASGSADATIRFWNVATWRELMRLETKDRQVHDVFSLAFSPDGTELLAAGRSSAIWMAAPLLWENSDKAAGKLAGLLDSQLDFRSRLRMLSSHPGLSKALEKLRQQRPDDLPVQAALAATRANGLASLDQWSEAVQEVDRFSALSQGELSDWLKTPELLRVARALHEQGRSAQAAGLLATGAQRRKGDGLADASQSTGYGISFEVKSGAVTVTDLARGSKNQNSGLRKGDVILRIDETDLTAATTVAQITKLLDGDVGKTIRLKVQHPGGQVPQQIQLVKHTYLLDVLSSEALDPLLASVNARLAQEPANADLYELRAELAGLASDAKIQPADYDGVIQALSEQPAEKAADALRRIYRRRGDLHVARKHWQQALDDYAHVVADDTHDDALLASQALAQAESLLVVDAIVPTSEQEGTKWRYTTKKPADEWTQPGFNDSSWQAGVGAFGTAGIKLVRTAWTTPDIWLRRSFEFEKPGNVNEKYQLRVMCDDNAEVFLNGKPLARREGHTGQQYVFLEIEPQVRDLLVPGTNNLAVHCLNGSGPGAIDVGLYAAAAGSVAQMKRRLAASQISDPWTKLATAHHIRGDQQAIDQLVERRPKLAGPVGDLFIQEDEQDKDKAKDWPRAVESYNRGITAETTDVDLLSKRARAHEELKNWDAAAADWSRAAAANPDGVRVLAEFARRLTEVGQPTLALAQREKVRQVYELALQADPGNVIIAELLAQLLTDASQIAWNVLKPAEINSNDGTALSAQGGETLTVENDGSIFVSGPTPDRAVYTLNLRTDLPTVSAIRLETLLDARLPTGGAGRFPGNGNFHLAEFAAAIRSDKGDGKLTPIEISSAIADDKLGDQNDITKSFDGNPQTYWDTYPRHMKSHWAVFGLKTPVATEGGYLNITLDSGMTSWGKHGLGRFRLSVAGDPSAFEKEQQRLAPASGKLDPWLRLATACAVSGETEMATTRFAAALDAAATLSARRPIVQAAERFEKIVAVLHEQRPNDPLLRLALARIHAKSGIKNLEGKHPADALADLQKSRDFATRLLAEYPNTEWVVAKPNQMTSAGGATFAPQDDDSILVGGNNPDQDKYTIKLQPSLSRVTAIRLEALPHDTLPYRASGRSQNGDFALTAVTIQRDSGTPDKDPEQIKIQSAWVDFNEPSRGDARIGAEGLIDASVQTYWSVYPQQGQPHTAVLQFDKPLDLGDGAGLTLQLQFQHSYLKKFGIGHFRVSVSSDAQAVTTASVHKDLAEGELAEVHAALGKALAQQGQLADAATAFVQAIGLATDNTAKAKLIADALPFQGLLEKLSEQAPDDAQVQAGLARSLAGQKNWPRAEAARAKGLTLLKRQLAAKPDDAPLADQLAQLLLLKPAHWTVLEPAEMKSEAGATLTKLDDNSVLASGMDPEYDTYTITGKPGLRQIAAVRLEALPDPSLPSSGPGRAPNFVLSELEVRHENGVAEISSAIATHEQRDGSGFFPAEKALDHDRLTGWAIYPRVGQAHTAYFQLKAPLSVAQADTLTVVLQFKSAYAKHNLGRFRLSVTDDPQDFVGERQQLGSTQIANPWAKLAAAYYAAGDQAAFDELIARKPKTLRGRADWYAEIKDWKSAASDYASLMKLPGGFPAAMVFDGKTTYVAAPHVPLDTYRAFTVEAWVMDWTGPLLETGNSDKQENNVYVRLGKPSGWKSSDSLYEFELKDRPESLWNHVALVYDGKNQTFFLNGELVSSAPAPVPGSLVKSSPLVIGGRETNSGLQAAGSGFLAALRISRSARYKQPFTPDHELAADAATVLLYDLARENVTGLSDLTGTGRYGSA
ncbi:MAG: PD40 domain-containing protein [Planctomycetia bacterium]|nr:PD40 domain-containing protein [Planctomycetia bacterium]